MMYTTNAKVTIKINTKRYSYQVNKNDKTESKKNDHSKGGRKEKSNEEQVREI